MLLTHFLNDFEIVPVTPIIIIGIIIIIIIIFIINYIWVVTRWQWLFHMSTKYEIGY
jgi:hypothetical protein